jgi:CBS domain-containing protein
MKFVKQLLESKGFEIWSVRPANLVYDAIELMAEKGVGALTVMQDEQLVGIISERDYARKVILKGRSSHMTPVSDIMTRDVICTSPHDSVETCMNIMTHERIRHLPVKDNNRLVGLISLGDLVKSIIAEQQQVIDQLEHYIRG